MSKPTKARDLAIRIFREMSVDDYDSDEACVGTIALAIQDLIDELGEGARDLSNTNPEDAKRSGWVVDAGDPGDWECLAKAHHDDLGIMKSTKRMRVPGGFLYLITTENRGSIAESLAFVSAPISVDMEKIDELEGYVRDTPTTECDRSLELVEAALYLIAIIRSLA